jgi:hypothetical protein
MPTSPSPKLEVVSKKIACLQLISSEAASDANAAPDLSAVHS